MAPAPLPLLREKCAAAIAYSSRRMWRRSDLTEGDYVALELIAEGLSRLGQLLRPVGATSAAIALAEGPPRVRELATALLPLAKRSCQLTGKTFVWNAEAAPFVPKREVMPGTPVALQQVDDAQVDDATGHQVLLPIAQDDEDSELIAAVDVPPGSPPSCVTSTFSRCLPRQARSARMRAARAERVAQVRLHHWRLRVAGLANLDWELDPDELSIGIRRLAGCDWRSDPVEVYIRFDGHLGD